MKKSQLPIEHIDRINFAVQKGLGAKNWEFINILSGGLTNVPVYKIAIKNKSYVIKLENVNDKNFDLHRSYKILESVSKQGISPPVYVTDADEGVVLMKYIESKPRPEASPATIKKFTTAIRKLHDKNVFPKWKTVIEILELIYQNLAPEYKEIRLVKECMKEIYKMIPLLFDPKDIRSCHCDLNPVNVLFDGENYFFVDWQAASPQSYYFDLAYCVNWFFFYSEDLCDLFLKSYLKREPTYEECAKFYLMRIFTNIYLGIGFISLPLKENKNYPILSEESIKKLPHYLNFMQSLGSGKINLNMADTQQQFGFIFLKTAIRMMDQRYKQAYELLIALDHGLPPSHNGN